MKSSSIFRHADIADVLFKEMTTLWRETFLLEYDYTGASVQSAAQVADEAVQEFMKRFR